MADNKESKRRIMIESDGTFAGTTVEVDGKAMGGGSKRLDAVAFMAEGPFDESAGGPMADSFFRFRASTKEKDGNTERISTIRISNSEDDAIEYSVVVESESEEDPVEDKEEKETPKEEPKEKDDDKESSEGDPEDETKEDDEEEVEDTEEPPVSVYAPRKAARIRRAEAILKGIPEKE